MEDETVIQSLFHNSHASQLNFYAREIEETGLYASNTYKYY